MPQQTRSMEQIIGKLREAEVLISQGQTIAVSCPHSLYQLLCQCRSQ